MSNTKAWIEAARLRTLPLSLSGILLGSGIAHYNGYWDTTIFILALVTTVLFQVLSNFANDLGDGIKGTDNDQRIGPKRSVQSGMINASKMKIAVIVTSIFSVIASAFLIYFSSIGMPQQMLWIYAILAFASIAAAITYTVGKKAYGYYGMGDLMVLVFFGGVSVLGVYSLYAKHFDWSVIHGAIFVGLMSTAVLNLNNMRDYQNDKKSGKNTLVVKMGPNSAKFYHMLLVIIGLASLFILISNFNDKQLFLGGIPALFMLLHIYKVMKVQKAVEFDPELKKVALSTFATCLLLMILLMIK